MPQADGSFRHTRHLALAIFVGVSLCACSSSEQRAQNHFENGQKLLAAHDNAKAAIEFKNAVQLKKDFLPAWRGLAQVDEADHRWGELVPVLRTIVGLDPKDAGSKVKLARLMLLRGATDEALKLVNGIDAADSNASVPALKAAILYKLKDTAGAEAQAQAALKIDPNNIDAMMVLAADRLQGGDAKSALQILDSVAASHGNDLGVRTL